MLQYGSVIITHPSLSALLAQVQAGLQAQDHGRKEQVSGLLLLSAKRPGGRGAAAAVAGGGGGGASCPTLSAERWSAALEEEEVREAGWLLPPYLHKSMLQLFLADGGMGAEAGAAGGVLCCQHAWRLDVLCASVPGCMMHREARGSAPLLREGEEQAGQGDRAATHGSEHADAWW